MSKPLNQIARSLLRDSCLVAVCVVTTTAAVEHRAQDRPAEGMSVMKVRALEIVNAEGEPCLALGVKHGIGSITFLNPGMKWMKKRNEPVVAFFGAEWPGSLDFRISDATGMTDASLSLSVKGEPAFPCITGSSSSGKPYFSLVGSRSSPVLHVWNEPGAPASLTSQ